MRRVLLICPESHEALALEAALKDKGHVVWHEFDSAAAMLAVKEFSPNSMITVSDTMVFVCNRDSTEISDFPRPVDIDALLGMLENSSDTKLADCALE